MFLPLSLSLPSPLKKKKSRKVGTGDWVSTLHQAGPGCMTSGRCVTHAVTPSVSLYIRKQNGRTKCSVYPDRKWQAGGTNKGCV